MNRKLIVLAILAGTLAFLLLGNQLAQASTLNVPFEQCLGAGDGTYQCMDSTHAGGPTYQFQDIAGNNPALFFSDPDDGVVHLTMPFVFNFFELSSDKLTLSMNGTMKFGSHIPSINGFNTNLTVAPTYFIAPFWDDIDNSPGIGGGVYTDVLGTAPDRVFIIQWENIPHYNDTGDSTFQVLFYEGLQEIHFQYEDVDFGVANFDYGASATIGLKGADGKIIQYQYNEGLVANHTAIRFRPRVIFTDALPAETTGRSPLVMTVTVPIDVAAGPVYVHTSDGMSNPAPFLSGEPFAPDATGVGTTWSVTASGPINANTVWSQNTLVTGDVTVASGVTLTINPGVTVFFAANSDSQASGIWTNKAELQVYGTLIAEGTVQNPVYFISSAPTPAAENWGGIILRKNSNVSMQACLVQYATYGSYFYNAVEGGGTLTGTISHCTFQNNNTGIRSHERPGTGGGILNTNPQILHSVFRNNTAFGLAFYGVSGAAVANNTALIQDNLFEGNDVGLLIHGNSWGATIHMDTQVLNNTFRNNFTKGLYIQSIETDGSVYVEPVIENNLFSNDASTGTHISLQINAAYSTGVLSPTIRYNTLANGAYGLWVTEVITPGTLTVNAHHNIFYGFSEYAIFNETARPITAEQNYWGDNEFAWALGATGMISGTGSVSTDNYLDFDSPPILTRIDPGLGLDGAAVLLHGANFIENAAPLTAPDAYTLTQGAPFNLSAPGVLWNDTDPDGNPIVAVLHTDVTHGALTLNPNGSFSYTPAGLYVGSDHFIYTASDGMAASHPTTVTLTIENAIPVALPETYTTSQVTLLTVPAPGVLDNDSDAGGDTLTAILDTDVANGTLSLNADGSFTYTPNAGFSGSDSFTYHANDALDPSNVVTVTLEVTNIAPVATPETYTTSQVTLLTVSAPGVLNNDSDAGGDTLTAVLDTDVAHGILTLNADGSFTYAPEAGYSGVDTFTYHASDGTDDSAPVTVTVQIEQTTNTHQVFLPLLIK